MEFGKWFDIFKTVYILSYDLLFTKEILDNTYNIISTETAMLLFLDGQSRWEIFHKISNFLIYIFDRVSLKI